VPVTGLDTLAQRPEALLVTTRDSRIRLYNGPLLSVKYKGHRNKSSRIPATLSSDGTFVICGSDDGSTRPLAPSPPPTFCHGWRSAARCMLQCCAASGSAVPCKLVAAVELCTLCHCDALQGFRKCTHR
jgi:hypothetical protein